MKAQNLELSQHSAYKGHLNSTSCKAFGLWCKEPQFQMCSISVAQCATPEAFSHSMAKLLLSSFAARATSCSDIPFAETAQATF